MRPPGVVGDVELTILYQDSYHEGVALAEQLIRHQLATGGVELELREEATVAIATAHTPAGYKEAVHHLGKVRGFREVVR